MLRIVLILIGSLLPYLFLHGQSVDMAEIKADGIVVPVVDHTTVVNPNEGQLAFNPMTNSYWYFDGGQWFELSPNSIIDTDDDTSISVEDGVDSDEVVFTLEGKEYGRIMQNANGIHIFSLYNDNTQRGNVVFGINSGINLDLNGFCCNSLFGEDTGRDLTSGSTNVMMGTGAGRQSTTANANTFIGTDAGEANIDGFGNVSLGQSAGFSNINSSTNVMVGFEAGFKNVAANNTFLGAFSGRESTTGEGNTFLGFNAGHSNIGGRNNIASGIGAAEFSEDDYNIVIGENAGKQSIGQSNIIIGREAGTANTGGSSVIIGWNAGRNNTQDDLMSIGEDSGINNQGTNNTFVGKRTGTQNTIGSNNTFLGFLAGQNNQTGSNNVMVGDSAGFFSILSNNTFIGAKSGINCTGAQNTFLGWATGEYSTTGNFNTIVGDWAGRWNGTGQANTYVGKSCGLANFDGNANTFLGRGVGGFNQYAVDSSVVIGFFAGDSFMASNRLIIENSNDPQPLIYGEFENQKLGVNWDSSMPLAQTLSVNGEASKSVAGDWVANSDARLKTDIDYLSSEEMLDKLRSMKAVSYIWNDRQTGLDRPKGKQYGFIAQDIVKVWPENVSEDKNGFLQTAYGTYDYLYVEAIKELANENEKLKEELKSVHDKFAKEIAQLKSMIKLPLN